MTKPRTALLDASTTDCLGNPLPGTKDVALVPREDTAIASRDGFDMFERMVRDPQVDPDKLERMMTLWERAQALAARARFDEALAAAQREMEPIRRDSFNPQTKSKYASYAALNQVARPIYTKHGLTVSYDTGDAPDATTVRVLAHVSGHGHRQTYHVDMAADGKGAKGGDVMTRTHATGAAVQYGRRYLLKMIFDLAEVDDDGNGASAQSSAPVPDGFEVWAEDMELKADEGTAALKAAWGTTDPAMRTFVGKHRAGWWQHTKARAAKADRGAK
jgi:hypothetical protein